MRKYVISLIVVLLMVSGCNDNTASNTDNSEIPQVPENPTVPTVPAQPTCPGVPVSPTDPVSPIDPVVPTDPVDPVEPVVPPETLPPRQKSAETLAKEWYVRIVVEDVTNNMKTATAQLGQLDGTDVVTKHTLKAIAPFRPTYLDVVFDNPSGVDAGSYKTNFHLSSSAEDTWEFTVKSHDPNADMILGWRGLYVVTPYTDAQNRERYKEYRTMSNPLLEYMTLEDTETNTTINALSNTTVNEYVFNMNGKTERVFRWTVKESSAALQSKMIVFSRVTTPEALIDEERLKKLQIEALRKDAKSKPDALQKRRIDTLDMSTPPKFEVLVK